MSGKQLEIVKEFLKAYSSNTLNLHEDLFLDHVEAHYTNLGHFYGKKELVEGLKFEEDFMDYTVTMTNVLAYDSEGKTVVNFTGQHLNYNEDVPYLFPVVYGGKYAIVLNDEKIEKIAFTLEYQAENTWYLHKWNLAKNINDYSDFKSVYDGMKQLSAVLHSEKTVENLTKLLFTSLDIEDYGMLDTLLADHAELSRERTYSNGEIKGTKETVKEFIYDVKSYYDLNQYGIRINHVKEVDGHYEVNVQLLSPQRLNTKKMTVTNKFHSFYDEEGTVVVNKDLKVESLKLGKVAEIYYNGFDVMEI